MNPDVFITIAFGGIAALLGLGALVFVVTTARRKDVATRKNGRDVAAT